MDGFYSIFDNMCNLYRTKKSAVALIEYRLILDPIFGQNGTTKLEGIATQKRWQTKN